MNNIFPAVCLFVWQLWSDLRAQNTQLQQESVCSVFGCCMRAKASPSAAQQHRASRWTSASAETRSSPWPATGSVNKDEPGRWLHNVSGVHALPVSLSLEQQPHARGAVCSGRSCQLQSRRSLQSPLFSPFVSSVWLPVANWNKWPG